MKTKATFIFFLLSFFPLSDALASDSTQKKGNLIMSISLGRTKSFVYGSMADRNKQFDENVVMNNNGGFAVNFHLQKPLSKMLYFKSGLSFIKKQVNPQENSTTFYKDQLNTGYLSIPLILGVNLTPWVTEGFSFAIEFGPAGNYKVLDNSFFGPDRVGAKTATASISLHPGAVLSYTDNQRLKFVLSYVYMVDVTNAHVQYLYWSSQEPKKEFAYKYNSHQLSFGLQWPIR